MNPVVSVLIPVYHPRRDYFPLAFHSILEQRFRDIEVLIIEPVPFSPRSLTWGGPAQETTSTGSTTARQVIDDLADPRVRYLAFPGKPSLVDQLNFGLQEAKGEFIARMDADDWSHPDRFAEQLEFLRTHSDVAVVGTQIDIMDERDHPLGHRSYPTEPEAIAAALCRYNPLAHPSVMYRKEAVLQAGGYRYRQYPANEDYELWCRLVCLGYRLANLPRTLLRYRIHPEGMKSAKLRGIIRGTRVVKSCYFRRRMKSRARIRFWIEGCLLILPSALVMHLFRRSQYRRI
jgi:glycosyltransferase involved in cell wall biosynthesis